MLNIIKIGYNIIPGIRKILEQNRVALINILVYNVVGSI
jgi:hypothetical protein